MAPAYFPTGSAYRLRERFCGTCCAQQGVSLSSESFSPTTQKKRESSGMKGKTSGVKERN